MIAVIPARGGSRRIPRKNVKNFLGRPMIAYAIECAKQTNLFDTIVVSSDDNEILHVAEEYNAVGIRRPAALCNDQVGTMDVMRHVLSTYFKAAQIACCIYPCVPLLRPSDLQKGFDLLLKSSDCGLGYVFSVGKEPILHDAGAFYWGYTAEFLAGACHIEHGRMYVLPPERDCDINTPEDWERALRLYQGEIGRAHV